MIDYAALPRLTPTNHRVTSPPDRQYNCVAWAAGDVSRWWEPGRYWPGPVPDDTLAALEALFVVLGYAACGADAGLEPGFLKVALYADADGYTHAARQLPDGRWTSKLGRDEDIEHDAPDDVAGGEYGQVMGIMRRPVV
jgi:hypothetical protein